jgi:3',5'-cyclic AMP phosphodiesterase CpdA
MWGVNRQRLVFILLIILLISSISAYGFSKKKIIPNLEKSSDDFYFVHITDTHVINENLDNKTSKKRFQDTLDYINSFRDKPVFIAATGDNVEWGGGSDSGKDNYKTLVSCLYKEEDQYYADSSFSIPIYFTPGNHDYLWETNLDNYHDYICEENRYVVNYDDVSFFFMDSGSNYILEPEDWVLVLGSGLYDEDIAWLENELRNCDSTHKIVLMHHPAISNRTEIGRMQDVIARNRLEFINLCEQYDVELVLAGHTHNSRVFDSDENMYKNYPINCYTVPTLFVQTDDCKEGIHYRNISYIDGEIWLNSCVEVKVKPKNIRSIMFRFPSWIIKILSIFLEF